MLLAACQAASYSSLARMISRALSPKAGVKGTNFKSGWSVSLSQFLNDGRSSNPSPSLGEVNRRCMNVRLGKDLGVKIGQKSNYR